MKNTMKLIFANVLLMAFSGYSAVFLSEDFEDQTVGTQPADAIIVRPSVNISNSLVQVTGSAFNTVGTGEEEAILFPGDDEAARYLRQSEIRKCLKI